MAEIIFIEYKTLTAPSKESMKMFWSNTELSFNLPASAVYSI